MSEGYEALRRGAAFLDVSARGRIVARGRDRARLLHNLSTNDVKKLTPGNGCYAFLLSPQGRVRISRPIYSENPTSHVCDVPHSQDFHAPNEGSAACERAH